MRGRGRRDNVLFGAVTFAIRIGTIDPAILAMLATWSSRLGDHGKTVSTTITRLTSNGKQARKERG